MSHEIDPSWISAIEQVVHDFHSTDAGRYLLSNDPYVAALCRTIQALCRGSLEGRSLKEAQACAAIDAELAFVGAARRRRLHEQDH